MTTSMSSEDFKQYVKNQVSEEDWEKLQEMNINLDAKTMADIWPDLVNFKERRKTEILFLLVHLSKYKHLKVFDAALGSGATTLGLKLAGIEDIVSNEIDEELVRVAQSEAERYGVALNLISYDWRNLDDCPETVDAVLCLGNSLTYLFKRDDQLKALKNFRDMLRPNGKLIIDVRNYAEHFLKGKYRFSGDVVYCGTDKVLAHPIFISENMVVMEFEHKEKEGKAHHVFYPFKWGEFKSLLEEAGFRDIAVYGDYRKDFKPDEPEFITYVCTK
ncbi:MAG: class I SAM-dependent methyltransferase [archaeon]|nr:class I SAM-dependent methyltransferase [archaeon]